MNKHQRDCLAICRAAGGTVLGLRQGRRHLRIICAEGVMIMPCTPSDYRWRRNALCTARRMFNANCDT